MPRRRPKKIVTWRYDDGAGMTMEVPVYQVTKHDGIWLRVDIPALDIREENSDINVLREMVFTALKARLVLKWEPFLQLSVSGKAWNLDDFVEATHINPTLSYDIEIQVARIEIGTRPDGSQCYRMPGQDSRIREWPGAVGDGADDDQRRDTRPRIPDTQENRRAMVNLGRAFFQLGRQLCDRLQPDNVNAAVAQLVTNRTLACLPALVPCKDAGKTKGDLTCPARRNR